MIYRGDWNEAGNPRRTDVAGPDDNLSLLLFAEQQSKRGKYDERRKWVHHPVKSLEHQQSAGDDEAPRDKRADDSEDENTTLKSRWNSQLGKDQDENEDVVDRERFFEEIGGEKGDAGRRVVYHHDSESEENRESDPRRASERCIAHAQLDFSSSLPAKQIEVERNRSENEENE